LKPAETCRNLPLDCSFTYSVLGSLPVRCKLFVCPVILFSTPNSLPPFFNYCFEFLRAGKYFLSGEDFDPATKIRLAGSLSENGHTLPISVGMGKSVGNVNLVLNEGPRDWIRRHAFVGIVMTATVALVLVVWLMRRKTRVAS
jgi:hypothetical protein